MKRSKLVLLVLAIAFIVAFGFATGGCEVKLVRGAGVLDDARLERTIVGWLADKHRIEATAECPDARPAKRGDAFTCEATTGDGSVLVIDVVQENDLGSVTLRPLGLLVDTAKDLAPIKAKLPASAAIVCPQRVLHLKRVGDTASCELRDGDERARLVLRYDDAKAGRFSMEVTEAAR